MDHDEPIDGATPLREDAAPVAIAGRPQPPKAAYAAAWYVERPGQAADYLAEPRSPVVLFGPAEIGKTWCLEHLLERHREDEDAVVRVNLELLGQEAEESADQFIRAFRRSHGASVGCAHVGADRRTAGPSSFGLVGIVQPGRHAVGDRFRGRYGASMGRLDRLERRRFCPRRAGPSHRRLHDQRCTSSRPNPPPEDILSRLADLRRRAALAPPDSETWDFIRWYLADPWTRTLSPQVTITVPEYIERVLAEGDEKARDELFRTFPGHPLLRGKTP